MAVRQIFPMQNNFRNMREEGICTISSLQWAKRCLELHRGIGEYAELLLSEHQLNALMAVWRRYDNQPVEQTRGMGLRLVREKVITKIQDVQEMHQFVAANAPYIAIFWNSFHTMGYRIGQNGTEFEWFDKNHGLYVADNFQDLELKMKSYMMMNYKERIIGVRVVQI